MNKKLGRGLLAILEDNMLQTSREAKSNNTKDAQDIKPLELPISQKNKIQDSNATPLQVLELSDIVSDPDQPRKYFDQYKLNELAESIKKYGVMHPIIVTNRHDQSSQGKLLGRLGESNPPKYQIVSGERRWRAAQLAGLHSIPALLTHNDHRDQVAMAMIENIQRENLNPIEEAEGYANLIKHFGYSQEELGAIVHKSRSHIANMLRLSNLMPQTREALINESITVGHAKCLVGHPQQLEILDKILSNNLNVRETEKLARLTNNKKYRAAGKQHNKIEGSSILGDIKQNDSQGISPQYSDRDAQHFDIDKQSLHTQSKLSSSYVDDSIAVDSTDEDGDLASVGAYISHLIGSPVQIKQTQNNLDVTIKLGTLEDLDCLIEKLEKIST